jgi:hypothetical protein
MALTLTTVQEADLSVAGADARGNPAELENIIFDVSDETVITLAEDEDDTSKVTVIAVGVGTAQVTVTADAALGDDETRELTGTLDVTVKAAEAVTLAISAGIPRDQPEA